nr:hypothetical protein RSP597_25800 [Ralstonia solanacearum]
MILNGQIADPLDYPFTFQGASGGDICTWFLVSAQALLGAAHCVVGANSTAPLATVTFNAAGTRYRATCTVSSAYWKDRSQDWAACRVDTPVPIQAASGSPVIGYEVIGTRLDVLADRPRVEISGYGCVVPGGGPVEGYRVGQARITEVPPNANIPGAGAPTPNAIKIAQSPSLLCQGDSGGPAFFYPSAQDRVHRVVVGINSATAIDAGRSYLASLGTPAALDFLSTWAKHQGLLLCGLDKRAQNCRPYR